MKQESFKNFVRTKPELIKYVQDGKMTWQKFYELYDIYGEDNNIWDKYILHEDRSLDSISRLQIWLKMLMLIRLNPILIQLKKQ